MMLWLATHSSETSRARWAKAPRVRRTADPVPITTRYRWTAMSRVMTVRVARCAVNLIGADLLPESSKPCHDVDRRDSAELTS